MNTFEKSLYKLHEYFYALMRIVVAFLFASHGAQKLFGVFGGHIATSPKMILAGVIEFFGGILIGLGFKTRYAAFIACGEMAVAYFMVHAHRGTVPIVNGGEKAVFYFFIFLFMAAYGSGKWSIDSLTHKK